MHGERGLKRLRKRGGRMIAALLCACMSVCVCAGLSGCAAGKAEDSPFVPDLDKDILHFWYTDDAMTDYLTSAAVAYAEIDDDIRIEPVLVSGSELLESINDASVKKEDFPDLYLASNDILEKAYLAGLAVELPLSLTEETAGEGEEETEASLLTADNFPQAALHAVSYKGKLLAYPLYYQTSAFLYNETYLEETGESAVPPTIKAIETFADEHDAPEGLESFFTWDVTDIFYNYFFVGDVLSVGGEAGDTPEKTDIYNEKAVEALRVYQELNQFFSIDANVVDYDDVLTDFINGKIMFTVVTTDAVKRLAEATAAGECTFAYAFCEMPAVDEGIKSRSMSVTEGVVVNGYSEYKAQAEAFAAFLATAYAGNLYDRTGKAPAYLNAPPSSDAQSAEALSVFAREYADSVPLPKMIETGSFWVELEIAFTRIWEGADADAELKRLSERILSKF